MNWAISIASAVLAVTAVLALVIRWFRGTAKNELKLENASEALERERAERAKLEAHEAESRRLRNKEFEEVLVTVLTPAAAARLLRAEVSSDDPRSH